MTTAHISFSLSLKRYISGAVCDERNASRWEYARAKKRERSLRRFASAPASCALVFKDFDDDSSRKRVSFFLVRANTT